MIVIDGYIKLYRKLLDNPIFYNPELFQLMVYLLLNAYFKDSKILDGDREIVVKHGAFVSGRKKMAQELKCNEATLYKRLKKLEKLNFCNIESNSKYSIITIVNWELYQGQEQESNSISNNRVTTEEQQSNNQVTQKKKDKNVKKDKKVKKDIYISAQHLSMSKTEYDKLVDKFGEDKVQNKIKYAENYAKLKNYTSLYLTLNNWLSADTEKNVQIGTQQNKKISFMDLVKED